MSNYIRETPEGYIVNLDKLKRLLGYLNKINDIPVDDIIWVKGSTRLYLSEDAKYTGLTNTFLAELELLND